MSCHVPRQQANTLANTAILLMSKSGVYGCPTQYDEPMSLLQSLKQTFFIQLNESQ